jgi:hypothetical protein
MLGTMNKSMAAMSGAWLRRKVRHRAAQSTRLASAAFVIVRIDRRDLVWINVTAKPNGRMGCVSINRGISLG